MITKGAAGYDSPSPFEAQCENCVMFKSGSCDLVMGLIEPYAVCQHWEQNTGNSKSVAQHLAERP